MKTNFRVKKDKLFVIAGIFSLILFTTNCQRSPLRVAVFKVDVTPPIGSPVAYAKVRSITDSLSARGIIIFSDEKPIVLCAVDWIGISNGGMDKWREELARAANTTNDRVSVHALHQHDGVECDFSTEEILQLHGMGGIRHDTAFLYEAISRVSKAIRIAVQNTKLVTHVGFGQAKVDSVASNRRILGPNGKVAITRWSSTKDSTAIAAPEGLIDPWLKSVSFWNKNEPIAVLTYYATHPQSYYGQGDVTCEFVGLARNSREKTLNVPHIHFNGASGNITAGKYNDGSPERRPILARRLEKGMRLAWETTEKTPLTGQNFVWKSNLVDLPLGKHLLEQNHEAWFSDTVKEEKNKLTAARNLAWLIRSKAGKKIYVSSLHLGNIWLLHLPGEAFIEYQLAAQQFKPNGKVCVAAYEEYGMGYIGTEIAYSQGGYETSPRASRVGPEVERVLMDAIKKVLE